MYYAYNTLLCFVVLKKFTCNLLNYVVSEFVFSKFYTYSNSVNSLKVPDNHLSDKRQTN